MGTTTPVSLLDRANTVAGQPESATLRRVVERAVGAEHLGYRRFWVAEHHAVPGIAGSAPAVLLAAVASCTDTMRVGSGDAMLPSHQPLVVAEQFATLQALFPGRVDLGVGRSLGFTPAVRAALRQGKDAAERFEADIGQVLAFLSGTAPVTARPQDRSATPVFVLATGQGCRRRRPRRSRTRPRRSRPHQEPARRRPSRGPGAGEVPEGLPAFGQVPRAVRRGGRQPDGGRIDGTRP